jgi:N-methylhydantoinase A
MHAVFIAEELEMPRVIVPPAPGNFSAFGSLISDLRRDYVRTQLTPTRRGKFAEVTGLFAELEREARAELAAEGVPPERISMIRALGMRYVGQSWELIVRLPAGVDTMAALETEFRQAHERRYGHASAGDAEIVNFRLAAIGAVPKPSPARWSVVGTLAAARREERAVHFDGASQRVPVYERQRLPGGEAVPGPALIEEMGATTVIAPGWAGTVGEWGELTLARRSL